MIHIIDTEHVNQCNMMRVWMMINSLRKHFRQQIPFFREGADGVVREKKNAPIINCKLKMSMKIEKVESKDIVIIILHMISSSIAHECSFDRTHDDNL